MPATKVSDLTSYQSPWLKASDLQGRAVTVVVERTTVEEIRKPDGGKEAKIVVSFLGKSKKLIANKTQALTLADLARTEEFGRWQGLTVILEPAKTRNGQDTINIRPATKSQASGAAATTSSTTPAGEGDEPAGAMPPMRRDDDNPFHDKPPEFAG
jgi:hypothetical protein